MGILAIWSKLSAIFIFQYVLSIEYYHGFFSGTGKRVPISILFIRFGNSQLSNNYVSVLFNCSNRALFE